MKYALLLLTFFCLKIEAQTIKDCSSCSTKIIKQEQLKGLSIDEVRLLMNEIFARNGYQFENGRFQNYFESKSWYKSKNDNNSIVFNDIEKQNIKLLQEETKALKAGQNELISQLKLFKTLVFSDRTNDLMSKFGFSYEKQTGTDEIKSLKEVLQRINIDDINYYKNQGLNSVTTDNGFVKIVYEITIDGNKVYIFYNYMSHSKIIKDLDEFTDYHSEDEYMYNWQFDFKNGKLTFIRLAIAG